MTPFHKPARLYPPFRHTAARSLLLAGLALGALAAIPAPLAAQAQAAQSEAQVRHRYAVPAGSLDTVLNHFARLAGVELSVHAALTRDKSSAGLNGAYTVEEGFAAILRGHSLRTVRNSNGSYSLQTLPADAAGTDAYMLGPVTVEALQENAYGPVQGLTARRSATATKTDTPVLEAPQTINVVARKQMDMQGAQTVNQAVAYTPGVISAFGGSDSRYDVIKARGGLFLRQYLDGIALPFSAYSVAVPQFDPYMLERIEVLQGPSSGLFGQTTPGGILNMISRRPQAERQHELLLQGGNLQHREVAFDSTGAMDGDAHWMYRITGLYRSNDGHADYTDEERTLIAPSITWKPSDDTSLTVLAHYQHDDVVPQYQGLPAVGTLYPNPNGKLPRSRFSGEPSHEGMEREQYSLGYSFEHRLNTTWTLRQNLRYNDVDVDARGTPGFMLSADGRSLSRVASRGLADGSIFGIDNQAQAEFATGDIQHTLLIGLDYLRQRDDYRFASNVASTIDLYDPVYHVAIPELIPRLHTLQTTDQTGLYIQDQMRFKRWVITAGGRFDQAEAKTRDRVNHSSVSRRDDAFTGRLGVNYVFDNGIAPYASYATSFEPMGGTDYAGTPFEPVESSQFEVGVKYQPQDTETLLTIAAFHITQDNVLTPDSTPGHIGFSSQAGEVKTRGVNFEARTPLWPGAELIGAYAYTESEITKANPDATGASLEGRPLPRVPRHMASAWLNQAFSSGMIDGLSVGIGARYVGENYSDSAATLQLPSHTLWDAAVHYDLGKADTRLRGFTLAVTGSNLTDRKYVSYCLNDLQCFYGAGKATLVSLRKQW